MSKSKKVLLIVGFSLLAVLLVAFIVCYSLWQEQTKEIIMTAWDWLNKPLPVAGVSTLMIVLFAWKVFINSSFGRKQISQFQRNAKETEYKFEVLKEEYKAKIEGYQALLFEYEDEIAELKKIIKTICANSRNAKIKKIGASVNVCEEETTNNETETN